MRTQRVITRRAMLENFAALSAAAAGTPALAQPKALRVGAALPDPPFELMTASGPAGFDIDLMRLIAQALQRTWQLVRYTGSDFNGIFAGLQSGEYDCIASGTTITPQRQTVVNFCAPYVLSGQSLVVDITRHPAVRSIDDLRGLVIGVQQGNTSEPVAEKLVAEGRAARVRVYPYDAIETALADLSSGGCDAFMKLAPVMHWLVRERPKLRVVQTGITRELLGVSVRKGDVELRTAIDRAQQTLRENGTLQRLVERWLGSGAVVAPT
jgi:polar amino acid transport system substrate-binding protein